MRPEYRIRWEKEIEGRREPLKKPADLLRRALSSEDFLDSAVIGGVGVAEIIAGKVAESQIPADVVEAFRMQYPQHGSSFVEAVQGLYDDPDALAGLISGVKGKLFELDYAAWLNDGHLPAGWTAEVAQAANNPGWDIAIRDEHGHIAEFLQAKATQSIAYVREAIAAHPDIDVVVPHELYEQLAQQPEFLEHLVDGHQNLTEVAGHVESAVDHAGDVGDSVDFPFIAPLVAIAVAAGQNWSKYRTGKITLQQMLQNAGERGLLAVIASAAGWVAATLAHSSLAGIPVAMTIRYFGRQLLHNRDRRRLLDMYIETVTTSTRRLQEQLPRALLEGATG